jgi:hypothetical protein
MIVPAVQAEGEVAPQVIHREGAAALRVVLEPVYVATAILQREERKMASQTPQDVEVP